MTSFYTTRKAKMAATLNNNTCEREGIFEQFSDAGTDLYYYAVYSSSDSEGNITIHDVKREKFKNDVPQKEEVDDVTAELEIDEGKEKRKHSVGSTKKRYGFRKRRLMSRLKDEEFDTTVCNTSDESTDDVQQWIPSSDDETYDIEADNWAFVRGRRKKTQDSNNNNKKKNDSPKKSKLSPHKSVPLKIKLSPNLPVARSSKLQKIKAMLRNSRVSNKKKIQSSFEAEAAEVKTKISNAKIDDNVKVKVKKLDIPIKVESAVVPESVEEIKIMRTLSAGSPPLASFSKLSPTRIRCGYNPRAPTNPPQLRHIRRRLLRQTPGRGKYNTTADEGSTSSDDETIVAMKTRGRRLSRLRNNKHRLENVMKTRQAATSRGSNFESKSETRVENDSATVTSTGDGLKLVIRRQSVEQKTISKLAPIKPNLSSPITTENKETIKRVKLKDLATGNECSDAPTTCDTVKPKTEADTRVVEDPEIFPSTEMISGRREAEHEKITVSIEQAELKHSPSPPGDKDPAKKKKAKKKKKKDRGRVGSSAGNEEALDAQDTAMRLAMELPRYNWLVQHLIKENKIKAEDDKPINLPEDEQQNTQQLNGDKEKLKQQSPPSQINIEEQALSCATKPDAIIQKTEETRQEDSHKSGNNVKGTSMVGIVKPFQHIPNVKMSPANMESTEMSPPPLRIDEEDVSNHSRENNSVQNEEPRGNPSEMKKKIMELTGLKPVFDDKNMIKESANVEALKIAESEPNSLKMENNNIHVSTISVNFAEMGPQVSKPVSDVCSGTEIDNPLPGAISEEKSENNGNTNDTVVETEPEIKISNCFSLALDLTKKSDKNVVGKAKETHVEVSNDQPLDLSMGRKRGKISPKILDLSVKTPSRGTEVKVQESKPRVKVASPALKKEPTPSLPTQNLSIKLLPPPKRDSNNNILKLKEEDKVIVIDDDSVGGKSEAPPIIPPKAPPTAVVQTHLVKPDDRPQQSKLDLVSMKRCSSLDSKVVELNHNLAPPKRARMSLDEARLKASPNRIQEFTHKDLASKIPAQVQRSEKPGTINLNLTGKPTHYVPASRGEMRGLKMSFPTAGIPGGVIRRTSPNVLPSRPILPISSSSYLNFIPSDVNANNNRIVPQLSPNRLSSPQPRAPQRTTRNHSLDSANVTAQLVAQAYHPGAQHFAPYIMEQQAAVDKKIQELEAIKLQLATAQKTDVRRSPPYKPTQYPHQPGKRLKAPSQISPPVQPAQIKRLAQIPRPQMLPSHTHPQLIPPGHTLSSSAHIMRAPAPTHIRQHVNQIQQPRPASHAPPTNWRMMQPRTEQPRVLNQNILSNMRQGMPVNHTAIRQSHQAPPHEQFLVRKATPSQHSPPTYRPAPNQHPIPVPRITAPNAASPYYRNGGLTVQDTFRTRLNEPIIIEDDIIRHPGGPNPRKRHHQAPVNPHSLKLRRAHSYHPPLSNNRVEPSFTQTIANPTWNGPQKAGDSQPPPPPQGEVCVKCKGKAYFLCSGCRRMWYCSKECQLKDWTVHSSLCNG